MVRTVLGIVLLASALMVLVTLPLLGNKVGVGTSLLLYGILAMGGLLQMCHGRRARALHRDHR